MFTPTGSDPRSAGSLPLAVIVATGLLYVPLIEGGWIGDDHAMVSDNPALTAVGTAWTQVVHADSGPLYRPLTVWTHALVQALHGGPLGEHIVNMGLHLVAVALVASIATALGARARLAWLGAAVFGMHPGVTEAVGWISGRGDLCAMVLTLAAWRAILAGRYPVAGLLIAFTPFFVETWVAVPLTALAWMAATRKLVPITLLFGWIGAGIYAFLRLRLGLGLPAGSPPADPLGALGALATHTVRLILDPTAPDALPPLVPFFAGGVLALVVTLPMLVALRGRPLIAAWIAPLLLVVPTLSASAQSGLLSDRAIYPMFCGVGILVAHALEQLARRLDQAKERDPRPVWASLPVAVAWVLPLGLAAFAAQRAGAWMDESHAYGASYRKDPENPYAAFHAAEQLRTSNGNCEAALPLYDKARTRVPAAGNAMLTCLVLEKKLDEAVQLGTDLLTTLPDDPAPARLTAWTLLRLGRAADAVPVAEELTRRDALNSTSWDVLGMARAMAGDTEGARAAYQEAVRLDPSDENAREGLAQLPPER